MATMTRTGQRTDTVIKVCVAITLGAVLLTLLFALVTTYFVMLTNRINTQTDVEMAVYDSGMRFTAECAATRHHSSSGCDNLEKQFVAARQSMGEAQQQRWSLQCGIVGRMIEAVAPSEPGMPTCESHKSIFDDIGRYQQER